MENIPYNKLGKKWTCPNAGIAKAGQIMTASAFLESNPNPTEDDIKNAMHGNICRCGTYNRIYKAVEKAAEQMD